MPRFLLILILAACAAPPADPVAVRRAVRYSEPDLTPTGPDLPRTAPLYVAGLNDALDLGLGPDDELAVVAVGSGRGGLRHVRLQQIHAGVPVQGAELVVRADDSTFLGVNGSTTAALDGLDVAPGIDGEQAVAIAEAEHGAALVYADRSRALVILPRADGGAALAWRVELFNHRQAGGDPARWVHFVDAHDGSILRSFDALATEQASGPGGNPKVSRRWSAELDVEPLGDEFVMRRAIAQSWADVGVDCGVRPELCDGDGACQVESGETCASCPEDCGSCAEDCGRWKKAKCKLGRGDCSRCGLPDGCGDGVCAGDESDDNCAQDCGCAAPGATCGSVAPVGCWCDQQCEENDDCCDDARDVCW